MHTITFNYLEPEIESVIIPGQMPALNQIVLLLLGA